MQLLCQATRAVMEIQVPRDLGLERWGRGRGRNKEREKSGGIYKGDGISAGFEEFIVAKGEEVWW